MNSWVDACLNLLTRVYWDQKLSSANNLSQLRSDLEDNVSTAVFAELHNSVFQEESERSESVKNLKKSL